MIRCRLSGVSPDAHTREHEGALLACLLEGAGHGAKIHKLQSCRTPSGRVPPHRQAGSARSDTKLSRR